MDPPRFNWSTGEVEGDEADPTDDVDHGPAVRVELLPRGRASITAQPGLLVVDIPDDLTAPWLIGTNELAAVEWWSRTRAVFRWPEGDEWGRDPGPFSIGRGTDRDARLHLRAPTPIPFRRAAWARIDAALVWRPASRYELPTDEVRADQATSLAMRAADDAIMLKRAFEHAGIVFPPYGAPS